MSRSFTTSCLALLATLAIGCRAQPTAAVVENDTAHEAGLGHIDFPNTGPRAAQAPFLRGMLLLHSFEYDDAADSFREAQAAAPGFALAYWGEALTHCHPVWQQEDRDAAQKVLARLAPTAAERAAKAGDDRERGLLGAVEILFGDGARDRRARAYCDAMAALHARYPADLEIASLNALAVLGSATQGRDVAVYMRAGALAEEVLAKAPDHPGALHYAIHSFDDPVHAPLGRRMAERYGKVAPDAEHALHMPSHIWVALGMWQESIDANIASSAAADARRAAKQLGVDARGLHSLWWLLYSHLQLGHVADAERLLEDMRRDERSESTDRTRTHLVNMRAAFVVDRQAWNDERAKFEVKLDGLAAGVACAELYVRGRAACASGDLDRARAALAEMAGKRGKLEDLAARVPSAASCCAPTPTPTYLPSRLAARVIEIELSGLIALAEGKTGEGLARLAEATEREDALGDDFGPPAVVEPAHELLGRTLESLDRKADAAREYAAALRRAPNRRISVEGLARTSAPAQR